MTSNDLFAIAPLVIVTCTALVVLLVDAFVPKGRGVKIGIAALGLVAALAEALNGVWSHGTAFGGMMNTGGTADYFGAVFAISGLLTIVLSHSYVQRTGLDHGEFFALVLFSVAGMMMMAGAADLIIFFIGLELMSIAFYVLAAFARTRATSNESGLKYFLLGSFASGFLLYGIALLYGATGTTRVTAIIAAAPALIASPVLLIGFALVVIGLAFKVAAVPFHMWVPDVYEGAPTTVSGFMSTGGKAAAFSFFLVLFAPPVLHAVGALRDVLAALAVLSMIVGNIMAISQTSVKRMLAYSSVAHAGYILVGIVAANAAGTNGVLFYLLAYTLMNAAAFGMVSLLESPEGKMIAFDDYAGLSTQRPLAAALMALVMFSLAGIPPFAGFFGKYYIFAGAVEAGYTWLAIVGVIMSVVSAYYYLRLAVLMYFREQTAAYEGEINLLGTAAVVVSAILIVALGLFPSMIVSVTTRMF